MRQLEIRTRRLVNDTLAGQYHSVFKGRGMDFDEVREYVARRRSADDRLERHRAHRPPVREEVHRGARADHPPDGGRERVGELRLGRAEQARARRRTRQRAGVLRHPQQRQGRPDSLHRPRSSCTSRRRKGRRHVLRVVREILYFQPRGRGTDTVKALDFANHILRRRAIAFLISDFQSSGDPDQALERSAPRDAADQSPP